MIVRNLKHRVSYGHKPQRQEVVAPVEPQFSQDEINRAMGQLTAPRVNRIK